MTGICGLAWSLCGVVASFVGAACASASAFLIGLGARKSFVDIIRERCHDGRIQGLARRAGAEARLEEPMSGSDLDRVVEQYHRALEAFVRGDPELQKRSACGLRGSTWTRSGSRSAGAGSTGLSS